MSEINNGLETYNKLKRKSKLWPRNRWLFLVFLIILFIVSVIEKSDLVYVLFFFMGYLVRVWKGRPETELLLVIYENKLHEIR